MVAIEVSSRGSKRSSSTGAKFRKRSATGCCCAAEVETSPIRNGRVVFAPSATCCSAGTEKRTTARFRRPPALVWS